MRSWRTTVLGIAGLMTAVSSIVTWIAQGKLPDMTEINLTIAAITSAVGLLFAKDAKVGGTGTVTP